MFPQNINPALKNNILTAMYNVDEHSVYRQLNKQIYNETAQTFYDKHYDKPISNHEIINYLLTNPKRFGKVVYDPAEGLDIIFSMYTLPVFNIPYFTQNITISVDIDIDMYVHQELSTSDKSIESLIDEVESDYDLDMDLKTIYEIYKNRGDCMKVNRSYSKEAVVRIFNKRQQLKSDSFYQIYYYYNYLILNHFVFDILEKQFEPIPVFFVHPIEVIENEELDLYMHRLLLNPVDLEVYKDQKIKIINAIDELELDLLNYIHKHL